MTREHDSPRLEIRDDGTFALPPEVAQDFTRFLERNEVACVGVGQIRTPFDRAEIQTLYIKWAKRRERRIARRRLIALLAGGTFVIAAAFAALVLTMAGRRDASISIRRGSATEPPATASAHPAPRPDMPIEIVHPVGPEMPPEDAPPAAEIRRPPPPRPNIHAEVDRILEAMPLGNVAYNTPSSMRCDEKAKIQLLLSPRTAIEELKKKISGLGEKVGEQIRVADVMEANLYGGAFETHALRPARQAVGGVDDTEWQWEIVAKEPGNQELHLAISVF
jgi:hypothetical protein